MTSRDDALVRPWSAWRRSHNDNNNNNAVRQTSVDDLDLVTRGLTGCVRPRFMPAYSGNIGPGGNLLNPFYLFSIT